MTDKQTKSGGDAPRATHPAAEMKTAMSGFLKEFNTFQDDVKTALQQQEERQTMLDRKTMTTGALRCRRLPKWTCRTRRRSMPICGRAMMTDCAGWCWKARR